MKKSTLAAALALSLSTLTLHAQNNAAPGGEHKRPLPPIIAALDANSDGLIDADEIANAAVALKKLDKNGDGKLTRDEVMPPRPQGEGKGGAGGGKKPAADK